MLVGNVHANEQLLLIIYQNPMDERKRYISIQKVAKLFVNSGDLAAA